MAKVFRPKEVLSEAEKAEASGNTRIASKLFHALALHLFKREKFRESFSFLERAIHCSPHSARLFVLKAQLSYRLEQPEDLKASLREFISLSVEKKKLNEYAVYLEDQLREFPVLRRKFFEELLRIDRTTSFAFHGLAKTCMELRQFEDAKEILVECLKIKDSTKSTVELLNEAFQLSGASYASEYISRFVKGELDHSELESLLLSKRTKHKKIKAPQEVEDKELKKMIEELENELGVQVTEDIDSVKPLVQEFRKKADLVLKQDAKARMDLAVAFFELGLYSDAVEELNSVSDIHPLFPQSLLLQGKVFMAEGMEVKALSNFQRVIREYSFEEEAVKDALYSMVQVYSRMGDSQRAFETATRLEKMDPNYREIHRLLINLEENIKHER